MALEDYLEPEIAVTAVVTAAVFSPRARKLIRRGAVYGMAGILIAGDVISSAARSFGQGVQQAGAAAANATQNTTNQAKADASAAGNSTANAASKKTTHHKNATDQAKTSSEDTEGQV
jgi:hypothetical protein